MKVCAEPGCPNLQSENRCPQHRRTTTQRGYGAKHQRERKQWEPLVEAGLIDCRRGAQCLEPDVRIKPGEPWELGHPDAACAAPKAPEHRRCNRATATHANTPNAPL